MELYLILVFLFFTTMVCGLIGFGDALLFIPLTTLVVGLEYAVILMTIWTTVPLILNVIKYRHNLDKKFIVRGIITGIPGTIVGLLILAFSPIRWIELAFGLFLLTYVSLQFAKLVKSKKYPNREDSRKPLGRGILYSGGFAFGLFGALIGASGPINAVLLERTGHYREKFIGNFASVSFILVFTRIISYVSQDLIPREFTLILLLGFPISYLATKLGQHFTSKIPEDLFRMITFCVIGIMGANAIISTTILY